VEQKPEHAGDTVETARVGTGGAGGTAVDMLHYTDSCSVAMAGPASVGARSTELRRCFGPPKRAELARQEIRLMALLLMGMDRRPSVLV
jgi:hypothetical protein